MDPFPNPNHTKRRFDLAADTFSEADYFYRAVRENLIERTREVALTPKNIIDLGCGLGESSLNLSQLFPSSNITAIDRSEEMIALAKKFNHKSTISFAKHDLENWIPEQNVDLIFSNLALSWSHPERIFKNLFESLNENGWLIVTLFGEENLKEIRNAWAQIDNDIHVHPALAADDLVRLLSDLRFTDIVVDQDKFKINFSSIEKLFKDLGNTGGRNCSNGRNKGLTSVSRWEKFIKNLTKNGPAQGLEVMTHCIYIIAKKSQRTKPKTGRKIDYILVDSMVNQLTK